MKRISLLLCGIMTTLLSYAQPPPCVNTQGPNGGSGHGITNVTLGVLNNTTPLEEGYTYEYDSLGVLIPDLGKCGTHSMDVTFAAGGSPSVWIDWNKDGDFFDIGETYAPTTIVGFVATYTISVPFTTNGNCIMRVAAGYKFFGDPCAAYTNGGDFEDYKINVVENDMLIDSVQIDQVNSCYYVGSSCQPVLRIALHTSGTQPPATVTGFDFNTNGSTNPLNDIQDARVIYTGDSLPIFSCNNIFGTLGGSPNGAFTITGNQLLTSTTCRNVHYFWLVYDISNIATPGNLVDAECPSVSVIEQSIATTKTPITIAPTGNGVISGGTEICNNGLDDDCDGLIDCFDPDCAGITPCISEISNFFYGLPNDTCIAPNYQPNPNTGIYKEWTFPSIPVVNRFAVLGDLDGDNVSEIVMNNSNTNLVVLDGQTGGIIKNFPQPNYYYAHGVIADADANGSGEIYWTTDQDKMISYDYVSSAVVWGPITYPSDLGNSISIADFNGDGIPEIFDDQYIINTVNGALMGTFPTSAISLKRPLAIDVLPDSYCATCSGLEIVVGTHVLTVDIVGTVANIAEIQSFETDLVLKDFAAGATRHSTAADVNNDNLLDVVSISNNMIFSWDPRKMTIINSLVLNTLPIPNLPTYITNPVTINDFDNDNDLDFIFTVLNGTQVRTLIAIDNNFNFMWKQDGMSESSSSTSYPTTYDLNGDGNLEVIYRPESTISLGSKFLFILDAATGTKLDSIYSRNGTYTVDIGNMIADVDNDGEVEIITSGYPTSANTAIELMVIGTCETEWVCGRNVWNQHNYHPTFINDNLTVPNQQQNHAAISQVNNWGNQSSFRDTAGNYACPLPDLDLVIDSAVHFVCDSVEVYFTVCNIGTKSISEPGCNTTKFVSFYDGNPNTSGTLIKTDTMSSILDSINSCISMSSKIYTGNQIFDLYIAVNDSGSNNAPNIKFTECHLTNNIDNITINPPPPLPVTLGNDTALCGGTLILDAGTFVSYDWSTTATTQTININSSGTYTVTVTDALGCTGADTIDITIHPPLIVALGNDTTLCGGSVTLDAGTFSSYNWNTTATTQTINTSSSGTYTVTVTDGNGCTGTDEITITIGQPVTTTQNSQICQGDSVFAGGSWQHNTGTFNDTLTANNGCDSIVVTNLTVSPPPNAAIAGTTIICEGSQAQLTASGGGNYSWNTGSTNQSIMTGTAGTYTVTVTIGGCTDVATHTISTNPNPTADAGTDVTIALGNETGLQATGGGEYSWSPPEGLSCTDCENPTAKPIATTEYCVEVTDNNGCTDTDCMIIEVEIICGEVFVPNAFSPNGDGENDELCVYNHCIAEMVFQIYDRWGERVFESTNQNICWDGTFRNRILNPGVFVYQLNATLITGEEIETKGNVSLVK